jgi:putative transposase
VWEKECAWAVVDALRQSILQGGVPLIFYTDNGPGYCNERMDQLKLRLGYDHQTSIPHNSQSRGVIERLQKTVWVELAAKPFSTYMGAAMDREARQIVFKASRKGLPVVPSWQAFLGFVEQVVEAYNARPSRACPKALDAGTGRTKHLSPDQTWSQAEALGWTPTGLSLSLDDFRPEEIRTVRRGEIALFGNTYFSQELAELHTESVRVRFDIHQADRIWIYRQDGSFVAEAGFEANKSAYFPKPYVDTLRAQRQKGQLQRLEAKAQRTLGGPEAAPVPEIQELTAQERELARQGFASLPDFQREAEPKAPAPNNVQDLAPEMTDEPQRPRFSNDLTYQRWVLNNRHLASTDELATVYSRMEADPALAIVLLGRTTKAD